MVFKNPYGFLIKHFKLINLVLTGIYIYLTIIVSNILGYYNDFILGAVDKYEAVNYVSNNYMGLILVSIVICLIVYFLLRYKKKPRVFYLVLILFSLVIGGVLYIVQGGLEIIYFKAMTIKTLRLYRDLLRILVVFQYVSICFVLVRGLGFDIKKFNFVEDLHELNLSVSDEEEVELTFGGTYSLQRKFHRRLREAKYYYFENKVFIIIVFLGLIIFGASSLFVKNEIIDKVYEQGEQFYSDHFSFKVIDSYITKNGYDNNLVTKKDVSFVIIKMIVGSNGDKMKLSVANLLLEVNNNSYTSSSYYSGSFVDLGNAYRGQQIKEANTYLFIYEVSNTDIDKKMQIVYAGDKVVNIKPIKLDEIFDEKKYKLGDKLDFSNSTFGSGDLLIENFEISDLFLYPYQYEIGGQVFNGQYTIASTRGTILKLKINSSYPLNLNNYDFLNVYSSLKYKVDGVEYVSKTFDNKTPGNEEEYLYLGVDKNISLAQEIWFEIQIRNYRYSYRIK